MIVEKPDVVTITVTAKTIVAMQNRFSIAPPYSYNMIILY